MCVDICSSNYHYVICLKCWCSCCMGRAVTNVVRTCGPNQLHYWICNKICLNYDSQWSRTIWTNSQPFFNGIFIFISKENFMLSWVEKKLYNLRAWSVRTLRVNMVYLASICIGQGANWVLREITWPVNDTKIWPTKLAYQLTVMLLLGQTLLPMYYFIDKYRYECSFHWQIQVSRYCLSKDLRMGVVIAFWRRSQLFKE